MSFTPGTGGGGGSGSVTSVSVASSNGFAGSVANPTTTPAITLSTSITGILKGNGTSVSAASASDITGQILTGYVSGSGTVASTDSILQAIQKINGNTALLTGAIIYQGTWNASTNTPTLASGVGTKGYMYKVSVAGTTTIDGISQWNAGDSIVFDGTTWDKIDGLATEVISVAGRVGAVTLAQADISGLTTASSPTFAGATLSGLTSGSVLFAGASGVISQNNANLSWDNTNLILALGSASTATGYIRFFNGSTANTVSIKTGSTSGSYIITLPTAVASSGQALIDAGGNGVLSWGSFSPVAGSASITTLGTITTGVWNAGAVTSSGTITTAVPTTSVQSFILSASSAVNPSAPTSGSMWWNGTNLYFYNGSTNKDLLAGGGITWASSISGSTGIGLTMTATSFAQCISLTAVSGTGLGILTSDLAGAGVNANFGHSSSGTLTAKTTADVGFSTARNHTANTTVTDNYTGFTFARTNVTSGSAGTLNAQGSVVSITGTDTQSTGTLTPTYNLLQLNPSALCQNPAVLLTIPNSVTSGLVAHSIVLGNTQTNATTLLKVNTGTSSVGHTGIAVNVGNVAPSATGISVALNASTGALLTASGTNIGSFSMLYGVAAPDQTSSRVFYANISGSNFSTGRSLSVGDLFAVFVNRQLSSGTVTDNFYLAHFKRTNQVASGTLTAQGAIMCLENTSPSATDTVDGLYVKLGSVSSGTGGRPLAIEQDNIISSHFRKILQETNTSNTLWISDGTTANGNLSGNTGDICFNGGSNKPEYCTGTTAWVALV